MTTDPVVTAHAVARRVVDLPSRFMLDMDTYALGATLGFTGVDFYVAGRGGALGEVDADVVTAAFVFFTPEMVRTSWERARSVMAPADAAQAFIELGWDWAEAHLREVPDLERTVELLGRVVTTASPAGAPLFGGWRSRPEPPAARPLAVALHRLNLLRELRGGLHGGAVLAAGIAPHLAVTDRSPFMLGIFGWEGPHPLAGQITEETWAELESATDRAMGPAFASLTDDESEHLIAGLKALTATAT